MNRYLSISMAGLIEILLVSGCSPSSASTNNSFASNLPSQRQNNTTSVTLSPSWKLAGGNAFLLQGKIVKIDDKAPYSLEIHLDSVLYSGLGTLRPNFSEPVGSTVIVRFREAFEKQGSMKPMDGEELILGVRQYIEGAASTPFWGSDTRQYYYKKNGSYYGENGLQLGIAT